MFHNGVMAPDAAAHNEPVTVEYDGLLSRAGADQVFLHYGVDGWNQVRTMPMARRSTTGFMATIVAEAGREINFCFKDSADNWDNNGGWNWACRIK